MTAVNFSGLASGIDSSSLIKSLLDQERKVKISPLQSRITELSNTNDSLAQLTTLLTTLNSSATAFRTLTGGGVSKKVSSSDEGVVSASATNGASNGTYNVSVSQLAKNATFSFGSSATTYSSALDKISSGSAFSDTVQVKIGNSSDPVDTVNISINQSTSLSDFVNEFNTQTSDAIATLVNVGSSSIPNYRVVINSSSTGVESGQLSITVGATISSRSAFNSNKLDDAKNAVFSVAGIATDMTRSSNSFSDVLAGVTLNLQDTGNASFSIGLDLNKTTAALKSFVGAYNEITTFIKDNDAITQEQDGGELKTIFGSLSNSSLDDNILLALRSALTSSSITGGLVNTLADLGVTTQRDGSLAFDEESFGTSLASDQESVQRVLENLGENFAASNGTIAQFIRYNGLIDSSENSNKLSISSMNGRIGEIEDQLVKYEQSLTQRFTMLEVLSGKLQSAQSALASLLP